MTKIILQDTNSGHNLQTINDNFRKIEEEFNEKVLYRDNPVGEPNEVQNDLDMNGNRIYNLPRPIAEHEAARFKEVQEVLPAAQSAKDSAIAAKASELSALDSKVYIDDVVDNATALIGGLGYQVPVLYVSGLEMVLGNQTVTYNGQTYAPLMDEIPFTTSGTFETDKFRLIQGVSGADLAEDYGAAMVGFKQDGTGAVVSDVETQLRKMPLVSDYEDVAKAIAAAVDGDFVLGVTSDLTVLVPSDAATLQVAFDRLSPVSPKITIEILIESGHKITRGLLVEHGNYSQFMISSEDSVVYLDDNFTGPKDGVAEEYLAIPDNLIVGDRASMPVLNCLIDMENRFGHGYRLVAGSNGEARAGCGVINAGHVGIKGDAATFYGPATRWDGASVAAIQATLASTFSMQRAVWSNSGTGIVCSRGSTVHAQSGTGTNCKQYSANAKRGFVNIEDANCSGSSENTLRVELGGKINARNADLRGSIGLNVLMYNDGQVVLTDAKTDSGTPGVADVSVTAFNAVEGRGIAFDQNSPKGVMPPQVVTWTPVIEGSISKGEHAYSQNYGRIVKTGNIAHVYGFIRLTNFDLSASGTVRIAGLPFNPAGPSSANLQSGSLGRYAGISVPTGFTDFIVTSAGNNPYLNIRYKNNSGSVIDLPISNLSNTTLILFNILLEIQSDLVL